MTHTHKKILLLCKDPFTQVIIKSTIQSHPDWQQSPIDVFTATKKSFDELTITEYSLSIVDCPSFGDTSPLEILIELRAANKKVPIILINRPGMERTAINCLKNGANYYLTKEENWAEELPLVMDTVLEEEKQKRTLRRKMHVLEEENQRMKAEAFMDGETRFYSSKHFNTLLSRELMRANRYGLELACLIMDVSPEEVKKEANNPAYERLALLLKSIVRSSDIWARIDDNRFAALMPHTSQEQAKIAKKRLAMELNSIQEKIQSEDKPVQIRWGMANYDKDTMNNEQEFLHQALAAVQ